MANSLEAEIASRALRYVLTPPTGTDPVVDYAGPDDLIAAFASTLAIPFSTTTVKAEAKDLLAAVDLIIRYSVHTSHPRFMNQNFAGPDPLAVVGDWLGAALNTTAATYEAAPVFTLMESAVLDKLGRIAGYIDATAGDHLPSLPPGIFCPGGSTATLYALQLARHRHQPNIVAKGASADRLVIYVSSAGHYAATKSASLLGIGTDAVVKVDSDTSGSMEPAALTEAIAESRLRGQVPMAVIATAGTTVTAAFDDLDAVADICDDQAVWLHVDGCYGGSALFSPTHKHLLHGVQRSDSFVWNLHKMMGMTQQCTTLLVRDPTQLGACFGGAADYLFQPDKQNASYDAGDRTFQCARRIDVLKLWLVWKAQGDVGFAERIDHAVEMANYARSLIAQSEGRFAPVVSGSFTNVVFSWIPPDLRPLDLDKESIEGLDPEQRDRLHRLPPAIKTRMQTEGTAMVGFQPVHGLNTFRFLVMNRNVTREDVSAVLEHIDAYGEALGS